MPPLEERQFATSVHRDKDSVVLCVSGVLDLLTVDRFRDVLMGECVRPDRPRKVFVDLSEVDFMGSAALRVLVAATKAGQDHGISLALSSPNRIVSRLLEVAGLSQFFGLTPR
jgi:anti-sigma B factor antagonist